MIDPDLIKPNLIEPNLIDLGTHKPTSASLDRSPLASFAHDYRASFPRGARLLKPEEFERVFKENERARTDSLLVMARPNAIGHARLGMIIAKRLLPRAVDRNRIKRCVRETFRTQRQMLPACDFVVRLVAKPVAGNEVRDLARTLLRAGQRAMTKWPTLPLTE